MKMGMILEMCNKNSIDVSLDLTLIVSLSMFMNQLLFWLVKENEKSEFLTLPLPPLHLPLTLLQLSLQQTVQQHKFLLVLNRPFLLFLLSPLLLLSQILKSNHLLMSHFCGILRRLHQFLLQDDLRYNVASILFCKNKARTWLLRKLKSIHKIRVLESTAPITQARVPAVACTALAGLFLTLSAFLAFRKLHAHLFSRLCSSGCSSHVFLSGSALNDDSSHSFDFLHVASEQYKWESLAPSIFPHSNFASVFFPSSSSAIYALGGAVPASLSNGNFTGSECEAFDLAAGRSVLCSVYVSASFWSFTYVLVVVLLFWRWYEQRYAIRGSLDPREDKNTASLPSLCFSRFNANATLLNTNMIYCCGGFNENTTLQSSVEFSNIELDRGARKLLRCWNRALSVRLWKLMARFGWQVVVIPHLLKHVLWNKQRNLSDTSQNPPCHRLFLEFLCLFFCLCRPFRRSSRVSSRSFCRFLQLLDLQPRLSNVSSPPPVVVSYLERPMIRFQIDGSMQFLTLLIQRSFLHWMLVPRLLVFMLAHKSSA